MNHWDADEVVIDASGLPLKAIYRTYGGKKLHTPVEVYYPEY